MARVLGAGGTGPVVVVPAVAVIVAGPALVATIVAAVLVGVVFILTVVVALIVVRLVAVAVAVGIVGIVIVVRLVVFVVLLMLSAILLMVVGVVVIVVVVPWPWPMAHKCVCSTTWQAHELRGSRVEGPGVVQPAPRWPIGCCQPRRWRSLHWDHERSLRSLP